MRPTNQKKKIVQSDPRRRPDSKPRKDRTTVALSIAAAVLFVLVILFLDRRIIGFVFKGNPGTGIDASPPVIQRVTSDEPQAADAEPVSEVGIPEKPDATPTPAEDPPVNPGGSGGAETTARLFFIRVSDEGKISIKSVLRPVEATGSPLTTSIKALIDGPRPGELSNDVLSLIPDGTKLIGARVEGGIAFLDFNEQFRFNALGLEGYKAQIEQVVYTATEYPTVKKVQILVEGQKIEYLGGEGFWVGGPLGRDDF